MMRYGIMILAILLAGPVSSFSQSVHVPTRLWEQITTPEAETAAREVYLAAQYFFPGTGDMDIYDRGVGAEAQYRCWRNANVGWAAALGFARWTVEDESVDWGAYDPFPLSGSMSYVPLGASLLGRLFPATGIRMVFEAGLRYAWVQSDIKITPVDRIDGAAVRRGRRDVDLDSHAFFAVAGMDMDWAATERTGLTLGIAYQHDLLKASAAFDGNDLRDQMLQAFQVRAGWRHDF